MSRYTDEDREKVRDAVDMVALVEGRTQLKRAGANSWFGRCPFHEERSGSFHVRPLEKHYHCFGCQASGDPFKFVMETEGLDFRESIEALADRFGVRVEPIEDDPAQVERRKRRERLLALLERTAGYYQRVLVDSKEAEPAKKMLAERGLTEKTLEAFQVGYSPSAWDRVLIASREAGFSEEELLAAGLAQRARGKEGIFDRFRGRIMFPLADQRGRVLGFGARSMRDEQGPKYLNSAEGELYHKGSQLFGLHLARPAAAKEGAIVLVEGYVDALALHQAGVENVVALMGTALTDEQAAQLERTAGTLLLALDADKAGQKAMLRAGEIAAGRKLDLRVVDMPAGKDPGDLLKEEGEERLRSRFQVSDPFVSFRVRTIIEAANLSTAEGKDAALSQIRPVLSAQPASVLREELVARVSTELGLSPELAASLVRAGETPAQGGSRPAISQQQRKRAAESPSPVARVSRTERAFLATCLADRHAGAIKLAQADLATHFSGDLERRAVEHLRLHLTDPLAELPSDPDDPLPALVAELLSIADTLSGASVAVEFEWLQLERLRIDRQIEDARRTNPAAVGALALEREGVRAQLDTAAEDLEEAMRAIPPTGAV
jgi:DNA primase